MGPRTALVEPKEMQASDGWDDVNKALFKEWELRFLEMVKASPHYHIDDAAALTCELCQSIDSGEAIRASTIEQERLRCWTLAHQHPMPRPDGLPPPDNVRFTPFGKKP